MPSIVRRALPALLCLTLAACGIDARDMNGSGYRALAFELPDEATKYFDAARELITEEVGAGHELTHPEYPRLRTGELQVAAWHDPDAAFEELRAELQRVPGLLDEDRASLLIDLFAKLERPALALAVADYAAGRFPDDRRLATKRENLRQRVPDGERVPPLAGFDRP